MTNTTPNPENDKKTTRDEQWAANAAAVAAYHAEHGTWPSARSTDTDARSLGAWLGNARGAAKGGRGATAMTEERVAVLDTVATGWSWVGPAAEPAATLPKDDAAWNVTLDRILARYLENGGASMPDLDTDVEPAAPTSKRDAAWAERLDQYRTRVEAAGALSTALRNSDDEDEARLGLWLMTQRSAHRAGTLSAERTAALEQVPGHVWDVRAEWFNEGLAALGAYIQEHGSLPGRNAVIAVGPSSDPVDIMQAAGRALRHHNAAEAKVVAADQIDAMQALGRVVRHDPEFKLGQWVTNQRRAHAAGKTTEERAAKLDAVAPGWNWVDGEPVPVASYVIPVVEIADAGETPAA